MIKVAIQGEPASFHDIAAHQFFKGPIELVCCETFDSTFKALEKDADYVVCAIENSLYGSMNKVYDLLLKHKFPIVGEVYLRVEQCLLGLPGAKIGDIREVHSHPTAIGQCEKFLDEKLPGAKRFESHDTAASAAMVKKAGNLKIAAIASRQAAKLYGLEILAAEIETNKHNYTRFVVLQKTAADIKNPNKTSLVLTPERPAGSLYNALGTFAKRAINLTKLQSRPIVGRAWVYLYYVDVDAGIHDLQPALAELAKQNCEVIILGSYKSGKK